MHEFIKNYWRDWFPDLPAYQTFFFRLNQLEQTFQSFGGHLIEFLTGRLASEVDSITDPFPVIFTSNGHSYGAKVAREIAQISILRRQTNTLSRCSSARYRQALEPETALSAQVFLASAVHQYGKPSKNKVSVCRVRRCSMIWHSPTSSWSHLSINDELNSSPDAKSRVAKNFRKSKNYHNRLVGRLLQPIESLFNWINEKTEIQKASKVRSTNGLLIYCWGKLIAAFYLLVLLLLIRICIKNRTTVSFQNRRWLNLRLTEAASRFEYRFYQSAT